MTDKKLLVEFFPVKGHTMLFDNTFRILSKRMCIVPIVPNDYSGFCNDAIRMHYSYYKESKSNFIIKRIKYILYCINIIIVSLKYARKENINEIICLTYEECSFAICFPFLSRTYTFYLMHHNNVDRFMNSRISTFFFCKFKDSVVNIVQCGFMAKVLRKNYNLRNVVVWPHPLNNIPVSSTSGTEIMYSCVGLSSSNDQMLINELILWEKEEGIFKKNNMKVVLKSKGAPFDDGYLKVINSFIPNDEFNYYISKTKSILIPFPCSFKNRMSGSLVDALTNNKYVIATDIPVIRECKLTYPNIIYIYNRKSFVDDLLAINQLPNDHKEFRAFQNFHSISNLTDVYLQNLSHVTDTNRREIYDF